MAGTASPQDRAAIVRAAIALIGRHGSAAVEDVLRAARVNRRTFYRYFATKDALLAALAEQGAADIGQVLAAAVTADPAAIAAEAWVEHYLALVGEGRPTGAVVAFLAPDATAGAPVIAVIEDGHEHHRALLADVLRRGRADASLPGADPDPDAFAVHAAVLRHVQLLLRGRSRTDLAGARASVTGVLRRLGG
ncbi:MAG: TetR/AcrR family transcriptional regulator [Pseudonocardia sp.]|nr:TetR/AcrR family transcriptional regulator [Pseudonocardia sp.]